LPFTIIWRFDTSRALAFEDTLRGYAERRLIVGALVRDATGDV
jgi:hypothetical protein